MRNILSSVPKKDSKLFCEAIKAVFRYTDIHLARAAKNDLLDSYAGNKKYEKVCQKLDEGSGDAFQYTVVGKGHSRVKSTNLIER